MSSSWWSWWKKAEEEDDGAPPDASVDDEEGGSEVEDVVPLQGKESYVLAEEDDPGDENKDFWYARCPIKGCRWRNFKKHKAFSWQSDVHAKCYLAYHLMASGQPGHELPREEAVDHAIVATIDVVTTTFDERHKSRMEKEEDAKQEKARQEEERRARQKRSAPSNSGSSSSTGKDGHDFVLAGVAANRPPKSKGKGNEKAAEADEDGSHKRRRMPALMQTPAQVGDLAVGHICFSAARAQRAVSLVFKVVT